MIKVLLITAPRDGEVTEFISPNILSYDMLHYPPLGLLAIAAEVDPRHELKVLDTVTKNMTIQESINYNFQTKSKNTNPNPLHTIKKRINVVKNFFIIYFQDFQMFDKTYSLNNDSKVENVRMSSFRLKQNNH